MLPRILNNYNLYIDGTSFAGRVEELTLPKLAKKTEEYQAAGMAGPIKIDLGNSLLELDFTLAEFSQEVLQKWSTTDVSGINARFLGAAIAADGAGTDAIEISVRGKWEELDFGGLKGKDKAKLKVKMPITYFRYAANSVTVIEIDQISGVESVNGSSTSDAVLKALGLSS
jgi:P2 family phage contractile tail tube protein